MSIPLDAKIESLLFFKNEPLSISYIAKILSVSEDEIKESVNILQRNLENRGISLVENNNEIVLATHPEMSEIITDLSKQELMKDLSKAAVETLSIILYRSPIKRSDIDYIRGVNSQFILRNLSIRGLIERNSDPKDERSFFYEPSLDLLKFLGINQKDQMPEYSNVNVDIENYLKETENDISESTK